MRPVRREPAIHNGKKRVLLALSEQRLLDAMVEAFHVYWPQAEVITALDAASCLRVLAAVAPDAVVLDADLLDRCGFDLVAEIRRASDARLVLLTAGDPRAHQDRAPMAGVNLQLSKPFSPRALIDSLRPSPSPSPARAGR